MLMCVSGIYALDSAQPTISTGAVDIDLKEYNNINEEFSENGRIVMPGETISLVPRVHNLGIECYIRTKITYTIDNTNYSISNYIDGNYKSWTKKGDYYYYEPVFNKNESLDIFTKVKIPDNLPNRYQNKKIIVNIIVDAVQARNFDGDWENTPIEKSINRTINPDDTESSTIIYENGTKKHITVSDNFFDNLSNLLPGDQKSEQVKLHNVSNKKNNYYLTIVHKNLTKKEKKLLKNINLVIKNGNKTIKTNLYDANKILLGTYKKNQKDEFKFTIKLPKELDNEYSNLFAKIDWKFSLKEEGNIINPITGDFKIVLSMIMFIISAIGMIIIITLLKNINKEERKI